jgi:DNA-directed RNA polymerase specialized sigma24 family protein
MDPSDKALIKAIGRADQHAMALLYKRYNVKVYRFAFRIIGDTTLTEDIVSDVFLEVWRCADGFKAKARVSRLHETRAIRRLGAIPTSTRTARRLTYGTPQMIRKS